MRFIATSLEGACIVEPEPHEDDRGLFARTFCEKEFHDQGLIVKFVQCNTSWNVRAGTIRGLHYQLAPLLEAKLVRCTAGSLWDVIVDLRPDSRTYLQHFGVKLTARNRKALYVPEMFAHGFQTLEDGTEVFYQMSEFYSPKVGRGLRFNDPKLGINWPLSVASISERDLSWDWL
ncbi:MAG: dTDP-4-dehydrorhamnose 3,5-epimerase [Verrucomicrobia bacterium]|nr:dTDP-4-dehydrorhamnose 3,5-epimerase [Verrucomicrobiota bacterium]MBV8275407.1 dTDP-4-dehydrorhamnose 3,5-epimerase [Verrucomicrobiota bacterium]